MKNVAAIVVTHNRKTLLLESIDKLLEQTASSELDIIIVDNASADGTREALASYVEQEKVIYLATGANLGSAGGFHYGLRHAALNNYTFAWLMDDDCMPVFDALAKLLAYSDRLAGCFGFLCSKVLWKDGTICKMNVPRKSMYRKADDFAAEIVPVKIASFVSLLIPLKIVREVGLPLKEFFIWTDDWEYTRRISRKHACYLVNESVVTHASQANNGADLAKESMDRLERYHYLYRNDVYLYRREGAAGIIYNSTRLCYHVLRVMVLARQGRLRRIGCIARGTWRGLSFRPKIEYI